MRRLRLVLLAFLLVALVAAVVFRSGIAAQARAVVVLSTVLETPVLNWTVEKLTDEPRVEEIVVAGNPTTLVRPGGSGPWPTLVFVNGATRRGRHHPDVQQLARGLARAGYLVLVPDLPGLRRGEITDETADATLAVARAAAARPDARRRRVGFVSVSVGATLALLAAEDPSLAGRVSVVAGLAPYSDLANVIRLATTGFYRAGERLFPYDAESFVSLVVARSVVAGLPSGPDQRALLSELRAVEDDDPNPLAGLRARSKADLGPAVRAVVELLANREARRFDALYAALPAEMRAGTRRLSPIAAAGDLRAPVELASAPHDKYFPLAESRSLVRAGPRVRLTVTSTLEHAIPEPSLADIADLFRFDAFVVRALSKARA